MKLITITIILSSLASLVFAQKTSAVISDQDKSFQQLLEQSDAQENQSKQPTSDSKKGEMSREKERTPSSYELERDGNYYLLKHARPPLYDRKYK